MFEYRSTVSFSVSFSVSFPVLLPYHFHIISCIIIVSFSISFPYHFPYYYRIIYHIISCIIVSLPYHLPYHFLFHHRIIYHIISILSNVHVSLVFILMPKPSRNLISRQIVGIETDKATAISVANAICVCFIIQYKDKD